MFTCIYTKFITYLARMNLWHPYFIYFILCTGSFMMDLLPSMRIPFLMWISFHKRQQHHCDCQNVPHSCIQGESYPLLSFKKISMLQSLSTFKCMVFTFNVQAFRSFDVIHAINHNVNRRATVRSYMYSTAQVKCRTLLVWFPVTKNRLHDI